MGFGDFAKRVGIGIGTLGFSEVPGLVRAVDNDPGAAQERERRRLLYEQAGQSAGFADQAQGNYGTLTNRGMGALDYLERQARGEDSVSAMQLKQALQRNIAENQSMAAGASPQNAAGAARLGAILASRQASGMAGNAALAGLQERNQAQQLYAQQLAQMRGQDLNAALQSRQNANAGYGAYTTPMTPEKSFIEKYGPAAIGAGQAIAAKSDRRAKKGIRSDDDAANEALEGLKSYTFAYKNRKDGAGKQLGVMAQDLERVGLKHAVIDTPDGKMVHGAKLATSNTAMLSALARRVQKLETSK